MPLFLGLEGIHNLNAINCATVLEIFRQQNAAASLLSRSQNQRIPKRKRMQPVEIDGCENIRNLRCGHIKLGQQLHLPARDARIDMQLSRNVYEILLQHLQGNNASPGSPVFGHKVARPSLFSGRRFVVRVKKDVGVEETTNAHEPRRD